MKTIIFFCFCLSFVSHAAVDLFQYPEDRPYTSADRGIHPYNATSIYKTGTFVLSYDDGPHPTITAQVLDMLKKHDTKAIFFVLTSQINDQNAYLIKRMLDEGHLVGCHGLDHTNSNDLPKEKWMANVKKCFLDLDHWHKVAGHEFTKFYYRFPYGAYGTRSDYHTINALKELSQELTGGNCINMVFWDIDTADWVPGMTSAEVAQNIIAFNEGGTAFDFKLDHGQYVKVPYRVKNPTEGGVVLQHDVHTPSVQATDIFLNYAKEHNLHIPRLDEVEEFKPRDCKLNELFK